MLVWHQYHRANVIPHMHHGSSGSPVLVGFGIGAVWRGGLVEPFHYVLGLWELSRITDLRISDLILVAVECCIGRSSPHTAAVSRRLERQARSSHVV